MREIEFRARFKKIATGEEIWQKSALSRGIIIDPKKELPLGYMQITDWEQYTGRTDKNGEKIFEGDKLQRYKKSGEPYNKTKIVEWWFDGFTNLRHANESEIIGNIHE